MLCEEALGSQEVECSNDAEKHKFCSKCFLKQAKASTDEIPLANGGIGVKCMAITCDGAITFGILISYNFYDTVSGPLDKLQFKV